MRTSNRRRETPAAAAAAAVKGPRAYRDVESRTRRTRVPQVQSSGSIGRLRRAVCDASPCGTQITFIVFSCLISTRMNLCSLCLGVMWNHARREGAQGRGWWETHEWERGSKPEITTARTPRWSRHRKTSTCPMGSHLNVAHSSAGAL